MRHSLCEHRGSGRIQGRDRSYMIDGISNTNLDTPIISVKNKEFRISAIESALSDVRLRYRAWDSRLSQLNSDIENLQYRLKITRTSHLTSVTEKSSSKFQEILQYS